MTLVAVIRYLESYYSLHITSFNMAAPQLRTDRVRVMCILYPKEGMSFEDWSTYWRVKHQEVFKNLAIVKTNVLSYEQVRTFILTYPFETQYYAIKSSSFISTFRSTLH